VLMGGLGVGLVRLVGGERSHELLGGRLEVFESLEGTGWSGLLDAWFSLRGLAAGVLDSGGLGCGCVDLREGSPGRC
jgi:hypothetical protein